MVPQGLMHVLELAASSQKVESLLSHYKHCTDQQYGFTWKKNHVPTKVNQDMDVPAANGIPWY